MGLLDALLKPQAAANLLNDYWAPLTAGNVNNFNPTAIVPVSSEMTELATTTTDLPDCKICTFVESFATSCTNIPGCLTASPVLNLTAALTIPVVVGTLSGDVLYTGISNALTSMCPPVTQTLSATQCTGSVDVPGAANIGPGESLETGSLEVTTSFSSYGTTWMRDLMISSLAQTAKSSANGSNCGMVTYLQTEDKRDISMAGLNETVSDLSFADVAARGDHPQTIPLHEYFCAISSEVEINYWPAGWREAAGPSAQDSLSVRYTFQPAKVDLLACIFIDIVKGFMELLAPELIPESFAIDEAVDVVCAQDLGDGKPTF